MIHFTVGPIDKPTTLMGALRHYGVSSTQRRRIKQHGSCTINGLAAVTSDFVQQGDEIRVTVPPRQTFAPEPIPIDVVYEDEYLLVVNKPAGLLIHPTSNHHDGTLANAISWYYQETGQIEAGFHPMHRLDRNTSGLCMVAKEPQVQSLFVKTDLPYSRQYLAICEGLFPAPKVTVHSPIGRKDGSIIERCICRDGQSAWSDFTCLAKNDDYSLLSVTLHTGRTHQIRVHSAYLGHPLIGDDLYGGSRTLMERQALHALSMAFVHPMTHEYITVNSPLPPDMAHLIIEAGWDYIFSFLS